MRRREFIALFGGATAAWPLAALGQQTAKVPRVGVLWHASNEQEEGVYFISLRQGFSDLGYVEPKNIVLEHTYAAEQYERFNANATALVARNVAVLIAVSLPAAVAAKRVTSTVPIVFTAVPDPVDFGLVASLAEPGGNITGLTNISSEIVPKRIEIFKEAIPDLSRLALLVNPNNRAVSIRNIADTRSAAERLNITVQTVEVRSPEDFEPAFEAIDRAHLQGVVTGNDPMIHNERNRIAELAQARRLPTMVHNADMVEAGGLMTYAADSRDLFRRTPGYVDRILKGSKLANLPVEQPTKFLFVVNLKTAKEIGVNIPSMLLLRADKLIE